MEKHGAELLLQRMLGNTTATFREGQWEAIDAVVNQRRKLLVVQRTGWGKSAVYFIASKIFRDRGAGPTIIISPLLALMRNQVAAAERLGITAETLNSTNREEWQRISDKLLQGEVDCLLVSPERLANQDFIETVLYPIADRIGLLVVDEAHCISQWGYDFRPSYLRIAELREREIDPSRFVRALVTDPSLVGNRKEQLRFMNDLYCVASVMQDVDYLDCSFYDLFTPDELYAFYAVRNYQMYLEEGPSAEFGHRALSDAVPLLRNFVAEADEAIATGALSASLRYGHDVNVIPLVGLMGIEGCDTRESDYRKVDQAWSCWRVTPMATNIQLVFFRRPDGGDVLVKFLFNERESRIRLESDLAPYYRWDDVKRYFDERIATQTRR